MLTLKRVLLCLSLLVVSAVPSLAGVPIKDPENTLIMQLKTGRVVIEMRPDLAPKHVARIKTLVRQGFYDGTVFHRVIDGFMAQGGDPTGTGTGGSGFKLPAEFSSEHHVRGTVSMARAADPNKMMRRGRAVSTIFATKRFRISGSIVIGNC